MANANPSNSRQEQIRAQAKGIMDNFFTALKNSGITAQDIGVKRSQQTRDPQPATQDEEFRRKMFANAPNKDIDYILAEKKQW